MFAFTGLRPSIISGPFPCKPEAAPPNGLANGHATVVPSSLSSLTSVFLTNGSRHSNGHTETVEKLEHEIQNLKAELLKSQEAVRKLKEREKQLQERFEMPLMNAKYFSTYFFSQIHVVLEKYCA